MKKNKTKNKETAQQAYKRGARVLAALMYKLGSALEAHAAASKDSHYWRSAGDLQRVERALLEALDAVGASPGELEATLAEADSGQPLLRPIEGPVELPGPYSHQGSREGRYPRCPYGEVGSLVQIRLPGARRGAPVLRVLKAVEVRSQGDDDFMWAIELLRPGDVDDSVMVMSNPSYQAGDQTFVILDQDGRYRLYPIGAVSLHTIASSRDLEALVQWGKAQGLRVARGRY